MPSANSQPIESTVKETPLYKQEVEASGLSQKEWYAKVYLKSDHWKALKKAKAKEVGRKCQICGATKRLEFHHDNYREIYDVTTADLRILCKTHHHEFHFGAKKKKTDKFDIGFIKLDSPSLENDVVSFLSGLRRSLRNGRLNLIIKQMRLRGMSQSLINSIIALKSGKKARMLRLSMNSVKWRKEDFDYHWNKFRKGRQITRQMCEDFHMMFKPNLRERHIRQLKFMDANS